MGERERERRFFFNDLLNAGNIFKRYYYILIANVILNIKNEYHYNVPLVLFFLKRLRCKIYFTIFFILINFSLYVTNEPL